MLLFCTIGIAFAQTSVSGIVRDSNGEVVPGANIIEKGSNNGTVTDFDGAYSLDVNDGAVLVLSNVGYGTSEIDFSGQSNLDVILADSQQLKEVVLTGSRTAPRSNVDSALPIDVVSSRDLAMTGQATFDKALQYRIPSFNTLQTPVNEVNSLLDPYEIRNMGPSRTLILINGKRKNLSALLYTQTSPGRGETGADISAIPTDAIKRVQILRDGASAQYGSDAIARVMNIILKDTPNSGFASVRTGINSEGDGEMFGVVVNNRTSIGDDNGFVNYTIDLSKVNLANRPGSVDAAGKAGDFGANLSDVKSFLARRPDAGNINGSPETAAAKFVVNFGYNLRDNTELYRNAAYVYKSVNSFANYRTESSFPYLADFFPNGPGGSYDGYVPTFEGLLSDYNATIGFRSSINEWNIDASFTTGGNLQTYKVNQSHNRNVVYSPSTWIYANGNGSVDDGEITEGDEKYRSNSQQSFDPGGTKLS